MNNLPKASNLIENGAVKLYCDYVHATKTNGYNLRI